LHQFSHFYHSQESPEPRRPRKPRRQSGFFKTAFSVDDSYDTIDDSEECSFSRVSNGFVKLYSNASGVGTSVSVDAKDTCNSTTLTDSNEGEGRWVEKWVFVGLIDIDEEHGGTSQDTNGKLAPSYDMKIEGGSSYVSGDSGLIMGTAVQWTLSASLDGQSVFDETAMDELLHARETNNDWLGPVVVSLLTGQVTVGIIAGATAPVEGAGNVVIPPRPAKAHSWAAFCADEYIVERYTWSFAHTKVDGSNLGPLQIVDLAKATGSLTARISSDETRSSCDS
jgi:hypothetical protein